MAESSCLSAVVRGRSTQTTAAVVLAMVACQNAVVVLLQHKLQTRQIDDSVRYEPLSAVTLSEGLKVLISVAVAAHSFFTGSASAAAAAATAQPPGFASHLLAGHTSAAVPALLYTLSAAGQSIGAYNLGVLPFLMLSEAKLVLTPVFGRAFLGWALQPHQWLCLVAMTAGMVLVQAGSAGPAHGARGEAPGGDMVFGVFAMLLAGACSALAGVYMEAVLKASENGLMVRNAQLAAYSCLCALGGLMWQSVLDMRGCFRGYTILVWALVLLQAVGGFLVPWAVRIASTIAKNYAQSLGFLAALTIPLVLSPHTLSTELYCGIVLVLGGVFGSVWKRDVPVNPPGQPGMMYEKPRAASIV